MCARRMTLPLSWSWPPASFKPYFFSSVARSGYAIDALGHLHDGEPVGRLACEYLEPHCLKTGTSRGCGSRLSGPDIFDSFGANAFQTHAECGEKRVCRRERGIPRLQAGRAFLKSK